MAWFDNCIVLIGCLAEVFFLYDYFRNFFELKLKKEYVKIVFIATCLILFGINIIGKSNVNLVLFPLLMWTFISILFESRIGVRIGYFISAYLVMIGVEFLFLVLSQTTSEMLSETGIVPVSEYGWEIIFIKFLNFIVFLILKQTSSKSHSKMVNKLFYIYLCVPIASLGIMITVFYSGVDFKGYTIKIMTIFFLLLVIGNVVLFYAFQKHTEDISKAAKQEIELLLKNAEIERLTKVAEINDDFKETMHNLTHCLKLIEHLAIENKVENIREIVEDLTGELTQREIYEYSNYKILNTILSEYVAKAERMQLKFDVYVEPGCVIKDIKDIDIVSMLGNILDNAFEAAAKVDNSYIMLRMFMHKKGKMCIIKVVNNYIQEVKKENGKIVTTKKDSGIHGIGLSSISKIVESYNGSFSYYIENKKFYAILVLPIQ